MRKKIFKFLSVVLTFAFILSLSACGQEAGTETTTKEQEVIIKKETPSSQASDENISDDEATGEVYNEATGEAVYYSSNDLNAGASDSGKAFPETDSTYEVDLDGVEASPTDKKIGLAMYHNFIGNWDELFADTYGEESTFMNYYRVGSIEEAKQVKAANGMCWLYVVEPYDNRDTLEFKENYVENFKMQIQAYKDAGVWDVIAGFETEEMTTRITHEQFIKFTKFLRDTCPDKRILSCTSPYEIQGATINGFIIEPMDYETFGYVTDIGFDMYHTVDYAEHKALLEEMKEKLGRKDVRIWFFPCTYKYESGTDEDYMIKSLDIAYDLLLKEENPGGIYMYTWETWGDDYGLKDLLDPEGKQQYTRLAERIVEIGKEILANPFVYDKPFN